MATKPEDCCPICLDSFTDISSVLPCLHQFCYGCIVRWSEMTPRCPLCKTRVKSILHLVRADDDFEEVIIERPGRAPASARTRRAGRVPRQPATQSPPPPATPQLPEVRLLPRAPVGGLQPSVWAYLFEDHPALLQRLQFWLRQQLRLLLAEEPSTAGLLEDLIICVLGCFGLDEEVLVHLLQVSLQDCAATFVQQFFCVAVQLRSREALGLLDLEGGHAAEELESRPSAAPQPAASPRASPTPDLAPSGSPAGAEEEEHPRTSTSAAHGGPSRVTDAPVPTHSEQGSPDDSLEAVAGPSTPSHCSQDGSQRSRKRRAESSQNPSQSFKRPYCWQK